MCLRTTHQSENKRTWAYIAKLGFVLKKLNNTLGDMEGSRHTVNKKNLSRKLKINDLST